MRQARGQATTGPLRRLRLVPAVAIAASVLLVGGVAAALVWSDDDGPKQQVAAPAGTTTTTTTLAAETPPTTGAPAATATTLKQVKLPAKLIAESRLAPFSSCNAFLSHVKTKGVEVATPHGLPGTGMGGGRLVQRQAATADQRGAAEGGAAAATAAPPQHSTTNVQEAGVDEPDTAKTDGKRIFTLAADRLHAVSTDGAPRLLGSITLPGAVDMLLVGNRLIVVGYNVQSNTPYGGSTITVVDASKPEAMTVVNRLEIDGSYVSGRLVNGVARIVSTSGPRLQFVYPTEPGKEAETRERNRSIIRNSTVGDWLPQYKLIDGAGTVRKTGQLTACSASYRPPAFSGFGVISVLTLDATNPGAAQATTVLGDGQIVYGTADRIYVATNQWGAFANDNFQPSQTTLIHKFDTSSRTIARYVNSGKVRGTALNQFALSEHAGNLRIATTDAAGGSESFVTVLADQGEALVQIGHVGGLGKGERIYSVRFLGDRGYVVTFRQVDPLYVVDLSKPTAPKVMGELKILGYSAYLHPIGDDLLVALGVDANEEGRRQGLAMSLFDVSNPAAPKRLQHLSLGVGYSEGEHDHHAFLYWAPTRLAVAPYAKYDGDRQDAGGVGVRVGRDALTEVGRIRHPAQQNNGIVPISRSIVVGGRLFTTSYNGVLASDLGSLADQAWVAFPQPQQDQPQPQQR